MPLPGRSELHHRRQFFQKIGQQPPKVGVVPLQGFDLVGVNAAVQTEMGRFVSGSMLNSLLAIATKRRFITIGFPVVR